MSYATYDSYKDSGVDWLGEIPSDWELEKAKWLFKKMERPVSPNDEIVTCFRDGQVTLRSNRRTEGFTNALKEHGYQGIRKGDLVIHQMDAFAGAIGISDSDGKSTPVYSACVPFDKNRVESKYYSYFLRNLAYLGFIESLAKGIRERSTDFRFSDFAKLILPVPAISEQREIVDFIDKNLAQIDQAIALKQQQIEKLGEYKQIVIQNAVTKGLNPNAPMKNSGVAWIGDIPEHWEVKKLKFIFDKIQTGTTPISQINGYFDGEINWFTPKDLNNDYLLDSERKLTQLAIVHKQVKLFEKNSVLVVGIGATSGKTSFMPIEGAFNQQITAFKSYYDNNKFYYYLIQSLSSIMLSLANYTTLPILNNEFFKKLILVQPSLAEQNRIVEYLNEQMQKFNNAKIAYQIQIHRLKEYKNILINQAVTGKIKI